MDEVREDVEEKKSLERDESEMMFGNCEKLICSVPVPRFDSRGYFLLYLLGSDGIGFFGFLKEQLA
jgi:hypothetical protein